ncbi:MAG: hypothetical protein U5L05_01015 [Rubrivivax sp.]|nr:hypothetical protein [Rubrivivax sp.]
MSVPALTHHEIVALVEPFARRGHHVDLAASDRAARKLVFKTVDVPGESGLRETLTMDCRDARRFVVERLLTHRSGLRATLQATGPHPAELLAGIESVAPAQHFRLGEGFVIARSYELWSASSLFLCRAQLQVQELTLTLTLKLPNFRSVAGDIALTPAKGARFDLPEDLLAVQGWDWARLLRNKEGWTSKLRLRGNALRRSRTAEVALEQAGRHLVQKFAEAPARFHDRHKLARWGVVFRRGIPTLTVVLMIGGALAMAFFVDRSNAGPLLLFHYAPIALLAIGFSLQELPQFEFPPWPRQSRAERWWEPSEGQGQGQAA